MNRTSTADMANCLCFLNFIISRNGLPLVVLLMRKTVPSQASPGYCCFSEEWGSHA